MADKNSVIGLVPELRELRKLVDALVVAKGGWTDKFKEFYGRGDEIVNKHRRCLEIEEQLRVLNKEYEELKQGGNNV